VRPRHAPQRVGGRRVPAAPDSVTACRRAVSLRANKQGWGAEMNSAPQTPTSFFWLMGNVASSVLRPTTLRHLKVREPQVPRVKKRGWGCGGGVLSAPTLSSSELR